MGQFIDLAGQRFGMLTVIGIGGRNKSGSVEWLCCCGCGNEKAISGVRLRSGETKSCGCRKKVWGTTVTLEQLLERVKYNERGCWEFIGSTSEKGYGVVWAYINGKKVEIRAHRAMWEIVNGKIPDKIEVCHSCDNPCCINPEHLFTGTHIENMSDMVKKGRGRGPHRFGETNPYHKLNWEQVVKIREYPRINCEKLAKDFGVSESTISNVRCGKTWKIYENNEL